jgi:hypothetical protein
VFCNPAKGAPITWENLSRPPCFVILVSRGLFGQEACKGLFSLWMATKLVAIATLVSLLAAAPGGACDVRPDKNLTGGAASIRTRERIAACGHAKDNRGQMTRERQDEVLKRYGLPPGTHPDYEIDHLIPLCLGGSDDPSNLWPQPKRRIEATWNAEAKDRLEGKICKMVCAGQINEISTAQEDFASDWITAYQKYYKGRLIPPTRTGSLHSAGRERIAN